VTFGEECPEVGPIVAASAMAVKGRRSGSKNPPIFSHEFVIQNHADIVACVAMVFVVGLMFQVTSPMAGLFIALHHNVTLPPTPDAPNLQEPVLYTSGVKDFAAIFFYLLIAVVMHQIVQEYLLDKVNRKLHLSKVKHTKFNESGQLLSFYLVSLVWAGDIMIRENLVSLRSLWEGYPHTQMTFMFKFFFIVQIAYWLHIFPELYFQKIKREDMAPRIKYASLYLAFIVGAYLFNYNRIALCLLVLHYSAEAVFHACRLLSYSDKGMVARPLYHVHEALFVLVRLATITTAVLTFWYGLALSPVQVIDVAAGTYNTFAFRIVALVAICLLQAYMMWNFITFHIARMRENAALASTNLAAGGSSGGRKRGMTQQEKAKARKEKAAREATSAKDDDDLPEVDQDTKKTLRQRK